MCTGIYTSFSLLFSALISHYSFVVVFAVDSKIDSHFVPVLALDYEPSQAKPSQVKPS
jgi:hypothetical protein